MQPVLSQVAIEGAVVLGSQNPNVLLVDSSFTPVNEGELAKVEQLQTRCLLISESNPGVPQQGPCFDRVLWNDVGSEDIERLRGLQDLAAGQVTAQAKQWQIVMKDAPEAARRVLQFYLTAVHGSRSYSSLLKASGGKARILPMRNLSSVSGEGGQAVAQNSVAGTGPVSVQRPRYKNGCKLVNWSAADVQAFENAGRLLDHQSRISSALSNYKSIRVASISLGYKKSWIAEDNPKCTPAAVEKEYSVLKSSWKNLFQQHPNVLFVVAAGNEKENFDNPKLAENDLWPAIASSSNLLLVGAMNREGKRYKSSNYGRNVEAFALGEGIPAQSPLPGDLAGHYTTLRGTSFSTPLVAGQILNLPGFGKKTAETLKKEIVQSLLNTRQELLRRSLKAQCSSIPTGDQRDAALNNCIDVLVTFVQNPGLLWADTADLFLFGKMKWDFAPFPMLLESQLGVSGQMKMMPVQGRFLPGLSISPNQSPEEMLLTLHHEVYHFASMHEAFQFFNYQQKINGCVTQYQLALLKDEPKAYLSEVNFFKKSPKWFKDALGKKEVQSRLLGETLTLKKFYEKLGKLLEEDPNFVYRRYVELGQYNECVLPLLKQGS